MQLPPVVGCLRFVSKSNDLWQSKLQYSTVSKHKSIPLTPRRGVLKDSSANQSFPQIPVQYFNICIVLSVFQWEGAARGHQEARGSGRGMDPREPAAASHWNCVTRCTTKFLFALRSPDNDCRWCMRTTVLLSHLHYLFTVLYSTKHLLVLSTVLYYINRYHYNKIFLGILWTFKDSCVLLSYVK